MSDFTSIQGYVITAAQGVRISVRSQSEISSLKLSDFKSLQIRFIHAFNSVYTVSSVGFFAA